MTGTIKLLIAALLIGCLLKVPYGYFQFVRIAGCIGFCYLAYKEFEEDRVISGILSVTCIILLNPVFKIHFTRKTWNNIDLIIAIGLLVWLCYERLITKHKV